MKTRFIIEINGIAVLQTTSFQNALQRVIDAKFMRQNVTVKIIR